MGNSKNILGRDEPSRINKHGHEVNSAEPAFEIAVLSDSQQGADYELSRIKSLVRREMSEAAGKHGLETWEEANDFEVDEPFEDEALEESRYMREEYIDVAPQASERQDDPLPHTQNGGEVQPVPDNVTDEKKEVA